MKLYNISINNLRRRKQRMIFVLLGLVIPVSAVVSLISISRNMSNDVATKMDEFGANILIVPESEDLSISYGGISVLGVSFDVKELRSGDIDRIHSIKNAENISIVAPKLISAIVIDGRRALLVGVDFSQELRLKKWWKITGKSPSSSNDVIVGAEVMQKLKLVENSQFTFHGERFHVSGVLEETGSQDDALIFADLKTVQKLLSRPERISLVEIAALCYNCPVEEIVRQASEVLPGARVTAVKQTIESKMHTVHRFDQFSIGISMILLLVGAMIVFTTVMNSVNERTREIGVFRALGFRQWHIRRVLFAEVSLTSFAAGILGYWVGFATSYVLTPIVLGHDSVSMPVDWLLFVSALFLAVALGLVATVYPAYKASRLDPVIALRAL